MEFYSVLPLIMRNSEYLIFVMHIAYVENPLNIYNLYSFQQRRHDFNHQTEARQGV